MASYFPVGGDFVGSNFPTLSLSNVSGNVVFAQNISVTQDLLVDGQANLTGNVVVGNISVTHNFLVDGQANLTGNVIVGNISGDTTVIGYGPWSQLGSSIVGEAANDWSGWSVVLSSNGNTVAIAAPDNGGNAFRAGQVRVFDWSGSTWIQRGLDIEGEASYNEIGYNQIDISSDGNIVAIGTAYGNPNGYTRIFYWSGSAWVQRGANIVGEAADDVSGFCAALSSDGNSVAIGALYNDGNGAQSGHVRVHDWTGSVWVQRGSDIDGEAANDLSGFSVAMSSDGNILAIGAPQNSDAAYRAGQVRIYYWSGSVWVKRGSDINGEATSDKSGGSVALSSNGNTVAIGANFNSGGGFWSGHVRVYDWSGSVWVQRGADINGEASQDESGTSVSLSSDGNTLAIGAPQNDGGGYSSGHVRIYGWSGSAWLLQREINGVAITHNSGTSVSLSSDGKTLAIGEPGYNSPSGPGQTRVFRSSAIATFNATAIRSVGQVYIDDGSLTKLTTASFNNSTTWSHNTIQPSDWAGSAPMTLAEAIDRLAAAYKTQHGPVPQL